MFEEKKFITVPEAIEIARDLGIEITHPTAVKWCRVYSLGHQPFKEKYAKWVVDRQKWVDFILGKRAA